MKQEMMGGSGICWTISKSFALRTTMGRILFVTPNRVKALHGNGKTKHQKTKSSG